MNLLVLPKTSQDFINDFKVECKKKMQSVMNELLIKNKEQLELNKYCYNCGSTPDEKYSTSIFWCNYQFCSNWCKYDTQYEIRKSYRE